MPQVDSALSIRSVENLQTTDGIDRTTTATNSNIYGLAFGKSKVLYPLAEMANPVIGLTKLSQNF